MTVQVTQVSIFMTWQINSSKGLQNIMLSYAGENEDNDDIIRDNNIGEDK